MFTQYLLVLISVKSVSSYRNLTSSVFTVPLSLEIFFLSLKATWRFLAKEFFFFTVFFRLEFPSSISWMRIFFLCLFCPTGRTIPSSFSSSFFSRPPSISPSLLSIREGHDNYFPPCHPTWGESPSFPWGAARTLAISLTSSVPFEFELNLLWKPFLVRLGSAPSAGKEKSYFVATVWKVCISGKTDIWKRTMIWLNQSSQMYL